MCRLRLCEIGAKTAKAGKTNTQISKDDDNSICTATVSLQRNQERSFAAFQVTMIDTVDSFPLPGFPVELRISNLPPFIGTFAQLSAMKKHDYFLAKIVRSGADMVTNCVKSREAELAQPRAGSSAHFFVDSAW